jgi:cysteine sulfinate desulfinase/cysteine desulfurase-like protein
VGLRAAVAAVAAITAASGIVVDACLPYLTEHFGNPSSSHANEHARTPLSPQREPQSPSS